MVIRYEIRVCGPLGASWATWFDGFEVKHDASGDTIIAGEVVDEAAFYGLMSRARDLGLTILSVERR